MTWSHTGPPGASPQGDGPSAPRSPDQASVSDRSSDHRWADTSQRPAAAGDTSARRGGTRGGASSSSGIVAVVDALRQKYGWRLNTPLGEGGFGYVYWEEVGGLPRAVKISKSPLAAGQQAESLAELKTLRDLGGHPRLLTLIQYEVVLGHLVTVWELAEKTLENWLREQQEAGKPGLPLEPLVRGMLQAAEGIDFLNKHGIYHRDIKPHNLFVVKGHVKLGDLGLAKEGTASVMSHTGAGSLGYMPPEAMDGKLHPSIDRYALVASYVRLRTGRHPFGPPDQFAVVWKRLEQGACETAGMTEAEAEWVRVGLSPRPEERPAKAVDWVRELARRLSGGSARKSSRAAEPPPSVARPARSFPERGVPLIQPGETERPPAKLAEAVVAAKEGATIQLAAGEHRLASPLEISRSLTLIGPGPERCRITCDGQGYVVKFSGSGRFAAKGIRFEHVGGQPADVIAIDSGEIELTNCHGVGAVWDAEKKYGGDGLWAFGTARGTVRNCLFERNRTFGIGLGGEAQLTIEANTCRTNGVCGIAFIGQSSGVARGNQCYGNEIHGIYAGQQSWPTLEENRCERNQMCGIAFWETASGAARNNVCRENGQADIFIANTASPALEGNQGRVVRESEPREPEAAARSELEAEAAAQRQRKTDPYSTAIGLAKLSMIVIPILGMTVGLIIGLYCGWIEARKTDRLEFLITDLIGGALGGAFVGAIYGAIFGVVFAPILGLVGAVVTAILGAIGGGNSEKSE
jgi:parallel beta-helix repeat protein